MHESRKKKEDFLRQLYRTVYLNDILERHRIKNKHEFEEMLAVVASSIGAPVNPNRIANTFKTEKGIALDRKTIAGYLEFLEDTFFVERAQRYDVKGRRYINTLSKYYFQDVGLRNALLDFRKMEESHLMENVIYNELRARGYRVDVGVVEVRTTNKRNETIRQQLEVDFVVQSGDFRCYIQSALAMPDRAKKEQETASFRRIDDSFRKIIVVKDDILPHYDENGYYIVGLFDFLLDRTILGMPESY